MDSLLQGIPHRRMLLVCMLTNGPFFGYIICNYWPFCEENRTYYYWIWQRLINRKNDDRSLNQKSIENSSETLIEEPEKKVAKEPAKEPPLMVQIYTPQDSGKVFVKEFLERLSANEQLELEFEEILTVTGIKEDRPLLVVCMNTSRLGTDAKTSVKGIKDFKMHSAVLLVFHHKDEHALPNQPSSRVLVDPEFRNLHGIYDVACLTGKGAYPCDMNKKAASDILDFLRSYKNMTKSYDA